jgi:hypothetical protein
LILAVNLVSMRIKVSGSSIAKTSLFRKQHVSLSEIRSVELSDWSRAVVIRVCGGGKLTIPFFLEGARAIYEQLSHRGS